MTEPDETRALRHTVRGFLEQHAPVRAQLADDGGATWARLSGELGLTGLADPDVGTFVEIAAVLEEAGRTLLRAPLLSSLVAAAVLADGSLGARPAALALDGRVSAGDALTGTVPQVTDAAGAAVLLVATGAALHQVDATAPGLTITPLRTLDPTRPQARVDLDGVPSKRLAVTTDHARDLLHVALAAESVGAAQRCLELTVQHLKEREQFGRPLGSFQALRHRVADLTVELAAARSTAWYAARAAARASEDLPVVAPLAKATAADAFTHIAGECIQLHGGIGFTWEHDAHLYFKRAWSTALLHGDSRTLRRSAFLRSGC